MILALWHSTSVSGSSYGNPLRRRIFMSQNGKNSLFYAMKDTINNKVIYIKTD